MKLFENSLRIAGSWFSTSKVLPAQSREGPGAGQGLSLCLRLALVPSPTLLGQLLRAWDTDGAQSPAKNPARTQHRAWDTDGSPAIIPA